MRSVTSCADLQSTISGAVPYSRHMGTFKSSARLAGHLLSTLTAIPPNIPRPLGIQTMLLAQSPNLLGQQTLILTIVPLSKSLRLTDLLCLLQRLLISLGKSNLEGLHRALARANVHMCQVSRVNQLARSDNHLARGADLFLAIFCEVQLGLAGVLAALGPDCLTWGRAVRMRLVQSTCEVMYIPCR